MWQRVKHSEALALKESFVRDKIKKESDIFSELAQICASPGYVHAIAYLCYKNNTIKYVDELTPEDMHQQLSEDFLVRTEISTIIGLACKSQINVDLPLPEVIEFYINKTNSLLKDIHQSMLPLMEHIFDPSRVGDQSFNPFRDGSFLREAIFYSGESAYNFQYRDLSKIKYKNDDGWFLKNKGFSLQQVIDVVMSIQSIRNDKINNILPELFGKDCSEWTVLPAYKFTAKEISDNSNIEINTVKRIIESFVASIGTNEFNSLDDFNPQNAYPIIHLPGNEYLLFQIYSLTQALYETPFFWFNDDTAYRSVAMQHRGEFTESFSAERLKLVFGENRVFLNIDIYDSKKKLGEIDVLVIFANRAIILQAKSKKLTIASRKGNDNSLQDDFKKAVQDAYDQAYLCATLLNKEEYKLVDKSGHELNISRNYKEIYPFCVVSEHYPALLFQVKQFLRFQETENIKPPFIMDIFLLDVMTEFLQSPLYFLSYVNKRTFYVEKILSTHEITILSYHLKRNLWMDSEYSIMQFDDNISIALDLAMLVRRDNASGSDTPDGILTEYKGTAFEQIIKDIEQLEYPETVDLGFMLLSLGEDSIKLVNNGISQVIELGKKDGKHHDLTLLAGEKRERNTGFTIHCNDDHESISAPRLDRHCELRKYAQKSNSWFGICIRQATSRLIFGINKEYDWAQSDEMDELVKVLPKPQNQKIKGTNRINFTPKTKQPRKTGRNEKCPCGSGKKYKKCCLKQQWRM
jgi:hypothetical protein